MKTIIKSLLILAAILLIAACKSKSSKQTELVTKIDTTVVDSEFVNLSRIVAPSLARVIERISVYLDTVRGNYLLHDPEGDLVVEVTFNKHDGGECIEVAFRSFYHEYKRIAFDENSEEDIDKSKPNYRREYMKYHYMYKNKLLAFYNLGDQSKFGVFVDSTKLIKGKPAHYLTDAKVDSVNYYPSWDMIWYIHNRDSLELVNGFF